jgi:hypothetical protein
MSGRRRLGQRIAARVAPRELDAGRNSLILQHKFHPAGLGTQLEMRLPKVAAGGDDRQSEQQRRCLGRTPSAPQAAAFLSQMAA